MEKNFKDLFMCQVNEEMINDFPCDELCKTYLRRKIGYSDAKVGDYIDNYNFVTGFIKFDHKVAKEFLSHCTVEGAYYNTCRRFCARYSNDFEDAKELANMKVKDLVKLNNEEINEMLWDMDTACRSQIRYIVDLYNHSEQTDENVEYLINKWFVKYI